MFSKKRWYLLTQLQYLYQNMATRARARYVRRRDLESGYNPTEDIHTYGVYHSYTRSMGNHKQPHMVQVGPQQSEAPHAKPGPLKWKRGTGRSRRFLHKRSAVPFVQDQSHLHGVGHVDYNALKTHAEYMLPRVQTRRRSHPMSARTDTTQNVMHPGPRYTMFATTPCIYCKDAVKKIASEGLTTQISVCYCDSQDPHPHKSHCAHIQQTPTLVDMYTKKTLQVGLAESYTPFIQ